MLILMLACAPKTAPAPAEPAGPPALVDPAVWEGAAAAFTQASDWTLAPLAQLDRGGRTALVVWPMLDPQGQVVDDDVVGLTVAEDGVLAASNWRPDPRRLVVELGGDDWRVRDRDAGVTQQALGDAAVARAADFQAAREAGDPGRTVLAAQDFSRLFALPLVLDQTATGLLARGGAWTFVSRAPTVRETTFTFSVDGEPLVLLATPLDSDDTRWRFSPGP